MRHVLPLLFTLCVSCTCSSASGDAPSKIRFLEAVRRVETGGMPNRGENAKGDGGKAIGSFQIHYNCWVDAVLYDATIKGKYLDCNGYEYSVKIVDAYLRRYASKAYKNGDWETCSRIWNGGPRGPEKKSTIKYWQRVQRIMK